MKTLRRLLYFGILGLVLVYTLFPYYWALASSLKTQAELFATPVSLWPAHPTLENYVYVFTNRTFVQALWNSTLVCAATVGLSLLVGALAGYALGRFSFRGRAQVQYLVLSMTMFPQIAVLGGLFTMMNGLGLFNRLPSLVISYLLFTLPFTVWVLTSFFRSLPRELEEAAEVDGATPLQVFWKVLLPLVSPGLVTTGLLAFISCWNEFLYALSFVQTPDRYTVTRAITSSFSGVSGSTFEIPWGQIMAATVVVTIPLVVLVLVFQSRIIAGLTGGAVKG